MPSCKQCHALLPLDVSILFCPECGQSINLNEKTREQKKNLETVDMGTQVILTFIPFANLFAAYKLNKFRLSMPRLIPDLYLLIPIYYLLSGTANYPFAIILCFVIWLMPSLVMLYFIRRWSVEQNSRVAFLESLESLSD